jgi:hypothetical protein
VRLSLCGVSESAVTDLVRPAFFSTVDRRALSCADSIGPDRLTCPLLPSAPDRRGRRSLLSSLGFRSPSAWRPHVTLLRPLLPLEPAVPHLLDRPTRSCLRPTSNDLTSSRPLLAPFRPAYATHALLFDRPSRRTSSWSSGYIVLHAPTAGTIMSTGPAWRPASGGPSTRAGPPQTSRRRCRPSGPCRKRRRTRRPGRAGRSRS